MDADQIPFSVSPQSILQLCGVWLNKRQLLTKVKTRTPELKKKEVVYRVPCQDCDAAQIGETGRSLQKRLTEQKYAVKTNDRKNGIAVHVWDMDHRPDWEAAEVVESEPHYWKRRVLEAIGFRRHHL